MGETRDLSDTLHRDAPECHKRRGLATKHKIDRRIIRLTGSCFFPAWKSLLCVSGSNCASVSRCDPAILHHPSSEVKGWRLSAKIKLTHYSTSFAARDHLWCSQTPVTVPSAESIRRRILSRAARARPSTERKSSIVIAELFQSAGRKCLQEVDGLPKNCRRDSVRRLSGST